MWLGSQENNWVWLGLNLDALRMHFAPLSWTNFCLCTVDTCTICTVCLYVVVYIVVVYCSDMSDFLVDWQQTGASEDQDIILYFHFTFITWSERINFLAVHSNVSVYDFISQDSIQDPMFIEKPDESRISDFAAWHADSGAGIVKVCGSLSFWSGKVFSGSWRTTSTSFIAIRCPQTADVIFLLTEDAMLPCCICKESNLRAAHAEAMQKLNLRLLEDSEGGFDLGMFTILQLPCLQITKLWPPGTGGSCILCGIFWTLAVPRMAGVTKKIFPRSKCKRVLALYFKMFLDVFHGMLIIYRERCLWRKKCSKRWWRS